MLDYARGNAVATRNATNIAAATVENACFAMAIMFLIPPVPSETGHRYHPAYLICTSAMLASRLAARFVGRETVAGAVVKVIVIMGAAWAINHRVFDY